jgi:molybdate transport system ATP-binding protein
MALTATFRKSLAAASGSPAFTLEVDFRLEPGCTVLLGPSGSGKTTLLRCLAGLERPDVGQMALGAEVWFDAKRRIHRPSQRRQVGLVFSDYALFPRMNVRANVAYATREAGRVATMLERFELTELADRMPAQLSAGQQQRVALARALVTQPRLLLLDEPFSALDAPLRDRLQEFLLPLLAELGIPVFWVTHDRDEACRVGDRLMLLDQGRVIRTGRPRELLSQPGTPRAAELLGLRNRFTASERAPGRLSWGPWTLEVPQGASYATWGIAAERIGLAAPGEQGPNQVEAVVKAVRPMPSGLWIRAEVPGAGTLEVHHGFGDGEWRDVTEGMAIGLRLPKAAIYSLESANG